MKQEITVTVIVEVPDAPTAKVSGFDNMTGSSAYFSDSKNKIVLVKDMHICHVFNAFAKGTRIIGMKEMMDLRVYREMAYRLATEPME